MLLILYHYYTRCCQLCFVQLYPVWRNHNIPKGVKIRIFKTNVKSVLLYTCKTWNNTNQIIRKLQIFVNKCLRRIMKIKWTDKITYQELWRITQQKSIENQIKIRKWNWIGHNYAKKQEQQRKPHQTGIHRDIEEEVDRSGCGEEQQKMK